MPLRKYPDQRLPADRASEWRDAPPARLSMSDSADIVYGTIRTATPHERAKAAAYLLDRAPDLVDMLGLSHEAAALGEARGAAA